MSGSINHEFIERYQLELEKNPRSRVFAPLSEAYRKMGLIEEAVNICRIGVQANPDFAGGRVAYAKILLEKKAYQEALTQLEKAVHLSPDNLLAHSLMGDILIELRRPREALKAYKMVLFFSPDNERARAAVRKWEFLTAEEFEDEEFAMRPVFRGPITIANTNEKKSGNASEEPNPERRAREIERAISLADAFTVRNDLQAAMELLEKAIKTLGSTPELENRLNLLSRRTQTFVADEEEEVEIDSQDLSTSASPSTVDQRRQILESFLRRINERRLS